MPRPPNMSHSFTQTVVGQLCKPHNTKDERLVSKMEDKSNFSRHLKQFDPDLTTDLRCWILVSPPLHIILGGPVQRP